MSIHVKQVTVLSNCVGYVPSSCRMTVNDERERMWKEAVRDYEKVD
jgi:hypothetical protein